MVSNRRLLNSPWALETQFHTHTTLYMALTIQIIPLERGKGNPVIWASQKKLWNLNPVSLHVVQSSIHNITITPIIKLYWVLSLTLIFLLWCHPIQCGGLRESGSVMSQDTTGLWVVKKARQSRVTVISLLYIRTLLPWLPYRSPCVILLHGQRSPCTAGGDESWHCWKGQYHDCLCNDTSEWFLLMCFLPSRTNVPLQKQTSTQILVIGFVCFFLGLWSLRIPRSALWIPASSNQTGKLKGLKRNSWSYNTKRYDRYVPNKLVYDIMTWTLVLDGQWQSGPERGDGWWYWEG